VTDANLLLGYYDPSFFLGGRMALDREAAERALSKVGATLGLSAIDAAWGIHRMVVENMAAAARIHIVEKGKDPRAYASAVPVPRTQPKWRGCSACSRC
jgi:5-oxoprolinase (ATP-hydrolysing)/N-methylhydantoinase A